VFSSNVERDILITYGGSALRAAVAGSNQVHALEISPGVSLASYYLFLEPQYFAYYKLAYYATISLPLVLLLALLERRASIYFGVGLVWVAAFASSLECVMALASPRAFDWNNFEMGLAAGSVALVIFAVAFGVGSVPGPAGT
jgi:hypothetical protein